MEREAGNTQGFGRISPVTRPSPYSPVQFRGGGAPATPDRSVRLAPTRGRIVGRAAAIGAAIAAVTGALAWFVVSPTPAPATRNVVAPAAPAPAAVEPRATKPRVSTTLPQPAPVPKS